MYINVASISSDSTIFSLYAVLECSFKSPGQVTVTVITYRTLRRKTDFKTQLKKKSYSMKVIAWHTRRHK